MLQETRQGVRMEMLDVNDMLQKVKARIGLSESEEQDVLLLQMLEDAMASITLFCNRSVFPWQLEYVARAMAVNEFLKENGECVAAIKRGDTQITYANTITAESMTQEQRDICCKFRRFRVR